MASWDDLVLWVRVRYEVMAQGSSTLTFRLPTVGDRYQMVHVHHQGVVDGQDWIQIESPIAPMADIDLAALLRKVEATVVGGASASGDLAVLRHAAPLEDLSFAEFEGPFRLVTRIADELEQSLTGTDRF